MSAPMSSMTYARPRSRSLSWGSQLFVRMLVCLVMGLLFQFTSWSFLPWLMLIIAVVSMRVLTARTPLTLAVSIIVILHFMWVLVAHICAAFDLLPVVYSATRWVVFHSGVLDAVLMCSSQFLYLLTMTLTKLPEDADFTYSDKPRLRLGLFVLAVILSALINRFSFILGGGYVGNINEYWSGLPAIFVIVIAAWCVHQRKFGLSFLISINLLIVYWLSTGNRSEVLTLFVWCNVVYVMSLPAVRSPRMRNLAALGVLVAGFAIFSVVGLVRGGGGGGQSAFVAVFNEVFQGDRLSVSTVGSSVYSGAVAVDITEQQGFYYGETIFGQMLNTIPSFVGTPWERYVNPYFYFDQRYQTMGGFGLTGEGYLNFGMYSPIIFGAIFVLVLRSLMMSARDSVLASIFLLSFAFYSQRFFYYGYVYLHNMLLLFAAIWVVHLFLRMASKRR